MKKRLISVFLALVLLSSLSLVLAADSNDPVINGTGSGWSDSSSGYPSSMSNSWWRFIFQWIRNIFSDIDALRIGWGASSYPSGYVNSWYQRVRDDLAKSYSLAAGYQSGWSFNDKSLTSTRPSVYANSSQGAILQGLEYINFDVDNIRVNTVSITSSINSIKQYISDIHSVIANSTDVALRNNMESAYSSVNDNFLSGNGGSASSVKASAGEYGEVSEVGGIIRGLEPSGRDMSHLSGAFGDGDNSLIGWFSSRTAQELNPIMNNRRLRAADSNDGFVDFLAPNIDLIEGSRNND